ncbi:hypothetical protein Hanom_Chr14g01279681 [Helianthus anomalus]
MDGDRHSWQRRRWDGAAGWRRWWFSFGQVWSNHDQRVSRGFGLTIVNNSFGSVSGVRGRSNLVNISLPGQLSRVKLGTVPVRLSVQDNRFSFVPLDS